ncbi:hypothetical protein RJ641_021600 [Dillenia turbinata]|uniref:Uncharacterized protein n=1 Tax=Dillenia turbinata TaxID=194707 RepID=A0AAN8YT40_9MAGN
MSKRLEDLSCNRASPACISFPSSESLLIQSSKMIWSSGYVRSTALLPETTSKTTIPKLKTSDFAVANVLFWKLSGGVLAVDLYSVEASVWHVIINQEQIIIMYTPSSQPYKIPVPEISHSH